MSESEKLESYRKTLEQIKNMIEKSMALFDDNMNNILDTLGGLNE